VSEQGSSEEHLAYYNENDPRAAAWLRELIKAGAIAPGQVDERDIRDVRPSELGGFVQCHFFAGIGVWSYALRLAGWSDSEPVWTGSCPCQPFSAAGKGGGFDDERHLWPAWFHLIEERGPSVIFGEQVASPDGLAWLDLVQTDLEATGHAIAPIDLCAAGVGAPHIRQRLYWVAESSGERLQRERLRLFTGRPFQAVLEAGGRGETGELGNTSSTRGGGHPGAVPGTQGGSQRSMRSESNQSESTGAACDLADITLERCGEGGSDSRGVPAGDCAQRLPARSLPGRYVNGFWGSAEWIYCRDEKYRPVEPGSFPLAHGAAARVGRLRGYGNALVAEQAAAFIAAYRELGI
jgi:DNA (cytosine-5)-methyltransferase 1